jgi:hypothetical protein
MNKQLKVFWNLFVLLAVAVFGLAPASSAQSNSSVDLQPGPMQLIRLDPRVQQRYVPAPASTLHSRVEAASANIVVNYNGGGWTSEAQDAFEYAVVIWESLITSPINIEVDAEFSALGTNILGGAGPVTVVRNFTNAPLSSTWYPVATANKLAGSDQNGGTAEIRAQFSSNFADWDFGTGSSTPGNKISFVSVVLHELGHGLGFLGSMTTGGECGNPNWGCYGFSGDPFIYDRFVENGNGTALLTFDNNSTDLAIQLTSGDLFFDSPGGNFANGDSRVPIYAPPTWSQGSSYSHLDESFNSSSHALMTYSIAYGETIHHPGSVTLCMFEEMGWTVSETCSGSADIAVSELAAANDGPTLLGTPTQLSASITSGSNVTYTWDFGDSTGGSGASTSHTYPEAGEYTARVTATNAVSEETATTLVTVEESISGLIAANNGPTLIGETTEMSASLVSGSNVTYEWDFGDGETGSGAIVSHLYTSPGIYDVEVMATNLVSQETAQTVVYVVEQVYRIFLPLNSKQP